MFLTALVNLVVQAPGNNRVKDTDYPAVSRYSSLAEAFDQIIKTEDPLIIGVGEPHCFHVNSPYKSSAEFFGKEAVPVTAGFGFQYYVIELLNNDPGIMRDIKRSSLDKCGKKYIACPTIHNRLEGYDPRGVTAILDAGKEEYPQTNKKETLRVKIYPGNMPTNEFETKTRSFPNYPYEVPDEAALKIGERTKQSVSDQINTLISKGKVVSYSGFSHNDLEDYEKQSFVRRLPPGLKKRYAEVDIAMPATIHDYIRFYPERKELYSKLINLMPEKGAVLVKLAPRQYIILLPQTAIQLPLGPPRQPQAPQP